MKISFLMPGYVWGPSGGMRIAYEYANALVDRGHSINVIHPRRIRGAVSRPRGGVLHRARTRVEALREWAFVPTIDWQEIDSRVKLLFVSDTDASHIPDADAIFATAWFTAQPVLEYPKTKGEKFYLIQGYETWMGAKESVDATWRAPMHKVAIAKWLLEVGRELGCENIEYIPNAIDRHKYRLQRPIEDRQCQVAMLFHAAEIKGARDGIEAIRIVREKHPRIRVVMFGTSRRQSWVPSWAEYHRNPAQSLIVDEIYNKSSIFISPSWTEGFALPPAEAACCGCAIVATDSGGIREFVHHGVTGLLSRPKDPVALAANIGLLLENEELRVKLAKACHDRLASFTWQRSATSLEKYVSWVLEGNTSGRTAQTEAAFGYSEPSVKS